MSTKAWARPLLRLARAALFAAALSAAPPSLAAQGAEAGSDTGAALPAMDAPATVAFAWKSVPGAGAYLVDVKDASGKSLPTSRTNETKITLSLPPGIYSIRVVSLDNFLRPEGASAWKQVRVVRKGQPAVDSLSPARTDPGSPLSLLVSGENIDEETAASLRKSPDGEPILPLAARELGPGCVQYDFPPLPEIARYSLELDNKPDYRLVLPDCVASTHEKPILLFVEPSALDLLSAPTLRFSIRADKTIDEARIELERNGQACALPIVSRNGESITFDLPPRLGEGDYDLVIENDPLSISRNAAALRLVLPPPEVASVQPESIGVDAEERTIEVQGGDFSPELKATLRSGETEIEAPVIEREEGRLVLSLPAELAAGSYDLLLSNAASPAADPAAPEGAKDLLLPSALSLIALPEAAADQATEPVVEQAPAPAAPEPVAHAVPPGVAESQLPTNGEEPSMAPATPTTIVRTSKRPGMPFDIGLAWEYCLVLGNGWSVLYPSTAEVASLRARLGLAGFRSPIGGEPWELGMELRVRSSTYPFGGDPTTFVESLLAANSLELGASLSLPVAAARLVIDIDGGMAYSLASLQGGDSSELSSLDPLVAGGLELSFSPLAHLSFGADASFRYVFYLGAGMPSCSFGALADYRF
jgi:hypothetical protein